MFNRNKMIHLVSFLCAPFPPPNAAKIYKYLGAYEKLLEIELNAMS